MHHRPQQSPIDLTAPIVVESYSDRDRLTIDWSDPVAGTIKQDEHGDKKHVVFNGGDGNPARLGDRTFYLEGFHFHAPSEHWVDGESKAMELHVVHRGHAECDGRLVLGVFVKQGGGKSKKAPSLFADMEAFQSVSTSDSTAEKEIETDPREWLPKDADDEKKAKYYRYEGSLTTPGYDEEVRWVVFRDPLVVTKNVFGLLAAEYAEPARLPQPLNRRFVLANFAA
jgi:carbonic anhydrase